MPEVSTAPEEKASSSFDDLAAHLKADPYVVVHDAEQLAADFGLSKSFVEEVLDALQRRSYRSEGPEALWRSTRQLIENLWSYLCDLTTRLTRRPYAFTIATFVAGFAVVQSLDIMRDSLAIPIAATSTEPNPAVGIFRAQAIALVVMLAFQAVGYARHGRMRYPIFGSGIVALGLGAVLTYQGSISAENTFPPIIAALVLGAGYLSVMGTVTLVGGYVRLRGEERHEQKLSRQDLLDRLFYLQERLRGFSADGQPLKRELNLLDSLRKSRLYPIVAVAIGLLLGAIELGFLGSLSASGPVPLLASVVMLGIAGTTYLGVGYCSGGVRRALLSLGLMILASAIVLAVPYGQYGSDWLRLTFIEGSAYWRLFGVLALAIVSGMASHVDEQTKRHRRLRERDPAIVLAEIVQIQWRLHPRTEATCVMSVDVASSTKMKASADPLHVEYSFRAFQDLVARIALNQGGVVLSTAGDGAVLTFSTCADALFAGKEIQSEIARFNGGVNRLDDPFRVRVGIHTGKTSAQLSDVPFNEIIDIAAHVERDAPVGGIAITQPVLEHVKEERVAEMREQIDGHKVYFVLNPTLVT